MTTSKKTTSAGKPNSNGSGGRITREGSLTKPQKPPAPPKH